jgi:pimeloyl-ACP methyl ester carboxylesterase
MLALAYAAAHPISVSAIVLVGCSTFDAANRKLMETNVERRMDGGLRLQLERLGQEVPDPNERLRLMGNLLPPVYSYKVAAGTENESENPDARAHQETWDDMLRLQPESHLSRRFRTSKCLC